MALPLDGIRVLDLTRLLPGAFATLLLADQGADVVKVEDVKGGDAMRYIPPPHAFQALNRGKRSLAMDVRHPEGHAAFLRMVPRVDVIVESFRPGTLDRQGLGWEALRALNPRLVMCSLAGYPPQSPLAQRAGHDVNYVALDGLLAGLGRPLTGLVADYSGGYAAALAIATALCGRERTGEGAHMEVSLAGAALPLLLTRVGVEQLTGALGCYNVYETADGKHVSVGALEAKFFERLVNALGRPDLAELQYETAEQENLKRQLAEIFRTRTRDEWEQALTGADACVEPVLEPGEALRRMAANDPIALTAPLGRHAEGRAPSYCRHSEEVLAEYGFTGEEIAALRASNVVLQWPPV